MWAMTFSDLFQVPHFADTIASRGWHAWWTDSGVPLADYRKHLDPMMRPENKERAFVAHDGETYLGSALLIGSDFEARPHLKPWVAALWVEEANRKQGIATHLMQKACDQAAQQGHAEIYLCAQLRMRDFYLKTGWTLKEANVTGHDVFSKTLSPSREA
jgi:GNAT superfamily N-acetyltransferase